MNEMIETNANNLVTENYKSYAKYVLETRALPSTCDGLKLVQRRIIYAASKLPMKLIKTASLAGEVMKIHPHGDSTGAIYTMTYPGNSQKIFNIKGNHGGPGWSASSGRYTECYLNEVGRFNYCQFLEYADYEDGELGIPEPKALPCLIPYGLVEGSSGMGVGLSTDLMPLNLLDLIHCYKNYIKTGVFDASMVKPDLGPYMIENTREEILEAVTSPKGKVSAIPIIMRESDRKISTGQFPGKSVETVLSKLGWWITDDYVSFTNESTDQVRYTFEITNNKKGEITLEDLIYWVEKSSRSNRTYTRCMVDDDKNAVYCSLKYVVDKSLGVLNKAIDKWLASDKVKLTKKLALYEGLKLAKSKSLFDNIAKITSEQLVESMTRIGILEEVAREIIKKPISYLTRDHDNEMQEIKDSIDKITNHNRTDYLLSLYDQFESMIIERHNSTIHSQYKSDILSRPKIRLNSNSEIEIYQDRRQGYELGNKVYLVGESGWVYIRSYHSPIKTTIRLDDIHEPIIGLSTDKYKYLEVQTVKNKKGISYEISSLDKEKYLVKFTDGEKAVLAQGWNDPPKQVTDNIVKKQSYSRNY